MNEEQAVRAAFEARLGAGDPDALRALGHGVMCWMTYAFVAGIVLGVALGWALFA